MKTLPLPIKYTIGKDGRYYVKPNKNNCFVADDCYLSADKVTFVVYKDNDSKSNNEITEKNNLRNIQILADIDSVISVVCENIRSLPNNAAIEEREKLINSLSYLTAARNNIKPLYINNKALINKQVYKLLKETFDNSNSV